MKSYMCHTQTREDYIKSLENRLQSKLRRRAMGYEDAVSFAEGVLWGWYNQEIVTKNEFNQMKASFCDDEDSIYD